MLIDHTLFGVEDKVKIAIDRLRQHEPEEGYYLAYSGGKDSTCIYHLTKMSGVKFDAHYNLTTVDPPELVAFIREHKDVEICRPKKTMYQLIVDKMSPPTRIMRFCCGVLKENGGLGRTVLTGVRWEESVKRSKRKMYEPDHKARKMYLHPIIDWTEKDVWEFIEKYNIPYCSLYDEGFNRLGCIGCPMQGEKGMERDFQRWPQFKEVYLRAFQRMLDKRATKGKPVMGWHTPEDVMYWWVYGKEKFTDGGLFG